MDFRNRYTLRFREADENHMPNDHKMSTKWTVHMFANDNDVQKSNPQSMTNRMALTKDEGKRSKLMYLYIIIYI